jgi:hypothetical protein
LTRNRFKNDQGILRLSIPVWKKGLGLQKIDQVQICYDRNWVDKHLESLKNAYAKSPFFEDHLAFMERVYKKKLTRLIDFNMQIILYILEQLKAKTRVILLSDLPLDEKEPNLSVQIALRLGATHFLALGGAKKHLDENAFEEAGIGLRFMKPKPFVYPQLWGAFLPNLSTLDLLFCCGPKAARIVGQI